MHLPGHSTWALESTRPGRKAFPLICLSVKSTRLISETASPSSSRTFRLLVVSETCLVVRTIRGAMPLSTPRNPARNLPRIQHIPEMWSPLTMLFGWWLNLSLPFMRTVLSLLGTIIDIVPPPNIPIVRTVVSSCPYVVVPTKRKGYKN